MVLIKRYAVVIFLMIQIINLFFQIYTFLLFVRILSSWVPEIQKYQAMQWIGAVTDPFLAVFRRIIPPLGMIDISPIVAFLALSFTQNILIKFLIYLVV